MTIAAVSTPPGEGGISIIRISGEDALKVMARCFVPVKKGEMKPYVMRLGHLLNENDEKTDVCLGVYFRAPHSYTGEDVAEIHCHGGIVAERMCLNKALSSGARAAARGEFTKRAFLNGRISLDQAESVMDMISASSEAAYLSASRAMNGEVSKAVNLLRERLKDILSDLEAHMDFPEEMEEETERTRIISSLDEMIGFIKSSLDTERARVIRDGIRVSITGCPNTGKSSLFNSILGFERAIVSERAGTTRDMVSESINHKGMNILLMDTAGIRKKADDIETIGISIAREARDNSDINILLLDGSRALNDDDRLLLSEADERSIIVINKSDISEKTDYKGEALRISAKNGKNIDALLDIIVSRYDTDAVDGISSMNMRQAEAMKRALEMLLSAKRNCEEGFETEIIMLDINEALEILSEITGEDVKEDIIDRIFSKFCVGK